MDVIIPVYNCEHFIEECLISICAQTVLPERIILVDDSSTDRSVDIARTALRDAPLSVDIIRHERNRGAGAARNTGLAASTSELVWFVDADDYADREFLEVMSNAIGDSDFAVCRTLLVDLDTRSLGIDEPVPPGPGTSGPGYAQMLLTGQARAYPPTKLFRRKILGDCAWSERRCYEDIVPMLTMSLSARRIALVDAPLYRYRQRAGSTSTSFDRSTLELLEVSREVEELLLAAALHHAWAKEWMHFKYREILLPLAHMAMRADHRRPSNTEIRSLISSAIEHVSRNIPATEIATLVHLGAFGYALRGTLLRLAPGLYSRILQYR